ncbi:hypothetical protein, partial [Streptomyces sparsogenes]
MTVVAVVPDGFVGGVYPPVGVVGDMPGEVFDQVSGEVLGDLGGGWLESADPVGSVGPDEFPLGDAVPLDGAVPLGDAVPVGAVLV